MYDSTLRDGEQMPTVSFTPQQKLNIAQLLDEIGIPEIEIGFPAVSPTEEHTAKTIAQQGLNAQTLVLSRLRTEDIDAARRTDADIVLLFIASSPLHQKYKLHLTEEEIRQKTISAIQYAKDHGLTPSFSTEDSTRTPIPFLKKLVSTAVETGAQRIGLTDTLGCATPQTIHYLFTQMRKLIPTPLSAHLHNDFGLGLINALTALSSGATHICVTINGWGERAGNVPLEQLVMTLTHLYHKKLNIDTTRLKDLSQLIATYTNTPIPKTQPFVGDNIFTHESGIHVAAILENPQTYEPIPPTLVGNTRKLVIGKHTGKHMLRHLLQQNGITPNDTQLTTLLTHIKNMNEPHHSFSHHELISILNNLPVKKT